MTVRATYEQTEVEAHPSLPVVVVVIGESLRADHLPMNGYHRNTMPHMSGEKNLVSFPNYYTEYTYTDISVPHLLTRQRPENLQAAETEQSFITLFKRAGYHTAWFANQDISVSYSYFAHEADSLYYCNASRSLYSYDKWLDTDILPLFGKWIGQDGAHMAVIHQIGSHWWYPSHFTEEEMLFKPIITHKEVRRLDGQKIKNSYDNTIVATDRFLKGLTGILSNRNAIVFLVSDHGEGLGEEGVYLHAAESAPLHHPALMVWWSTQYEKTYPVKIENLKANRNSRISNQNIFNTVIDLGALSTSAWDSTRSLARTMLVGE